MDMRKGKVDFSSLAIDRIEFYFVVRHEKDVFEVKSKEGTFYLKSQVRLKKITTLIIWIAGIAGSVLSFSGILKWLI